MNRFRIETTQLAGLQLITRQVVGDNRGFLSRLFCSEELAQAGWHKPIAQINHTLTERKGTVRGMHFQHAPHCEAKLVTCIRGAVWDVAVDLRTGSPTFLQWYGHLLSPENRTALLIPEGFAHGFQSMTDSVEMLYCHSAPYAPESDAGLNPLDPRLAIPWPCNVDTLSDKDKSRPLITELFQGIRP
jgi:dTDP-4-dehydrorhamnose 3,5-epimerase